jgi:hypothetical protein
MLCRDRNSPLPQKLGAFCLAQIDNFIADVDMCILPNNRELDACILRAKSIAHALLYISEARCSDSMLVYGADIVFRYLSSQEWFST